LVAIGFLIAFIWSVNSGQYEDDYTPSIRILFDDDIPSGKDKDTPSEPVKKKTYLSPDDNKKPNK